MAGLTRDQRAEKQARIATTATTAAVDPQQSTAAATAVIENSVSITAAVGIKTTVLDAKPNGAISTKPTKPWDKGLTGNKPWRRDITALTKTNRDFHCRWVNNDSIDARIDRGYEIASVERWGMPTDRIIDDVSPLGKRIVRRNMTLMEIPMEGKHYFDDQNEAIIKARKRDAREMVKKQAEAILSKAGFAVAVIDKSKVEKDGKIVAA